MIYPSGTTRQLTLLKEEKKKKCQAKCIECHRLCKN